MRRRRHRSQALPARATRRAAREIVPGRAGRFIFNESTVAEWLVMVLPARDMNGDAWA